MKPSERLNGELLQLAHELNAALFITGSQYYAGRGNDFDFRLVVPDPHAVLGHPFLVAYARQLGTADADADIVGLKFERDGHLVSLQLMSSAIVTQICAFEDVQLRVLRSTETSASNDVYGFERAFEVEQPHHQLAADAWLVEIVQSGRIDGCFVTQIYHNMLIGCRVLRDEHGFAASRQTLLRGVGDAIQAAGLSIDSGLARLMRRSFARWTTTARDEVLSAFRAAAQ